LLSILEDLAGLDVRLVILEVLLLEFLQVVERSTQTQTTSASLLSADEPERSTHDSALDHHLAQPLVVGLEQSL
jgi:hypothetical protein